MLRKHIYYDTAYMTRETFAHVFKEKSYKNVQISTVCNSEKLETI